MERTDDGHRGFGGVPVNLQQSTHKANHYFTILEKGPEPSSFTGNGIYPSWTCAGPRAEDCKRQIECQHPFLGEGDHRGTYI